MKRAGHGQAPIFLVGSRPEVLSKAALGSMSIAKLHAELVDRAGRSHPLRAARPRPLPAHRDQLHHKRRGAGTAAELFQG